MPSFFQDLRLAIRSLRKSPGIVLVAVVSLGLGAGVNTAFFNVFHAIVLQKPTAVAADRLFRIEPGNSESWPYVSYREIRDRHVFPGLAAYSPDFFSLRDGADILPVTGLLVSGNFFEVVGVGPSRGRAFSAEEWDAEKNPDAAVISDAFAKRRFGAADPLGALLNIDARVYRVIGVLSEKYKPITGALIPDVYLPFNDSNLPVRVRGNAGLRVFARLGEGMTTQQARAVFLAQAKDVERTLHQEGFGRTAFFHPIYGVASWQQRGQGAGQLYALLSLPFVIFGMVLLIACANVAGVLIARGASRAREVAIRTALGASRVRVFQILFAESLVLSILGTDAGLLLSWWVTDFIPALSVPGLPFNLRLSVQMQPMVLGYALLMCVLTALFCGLMPALRMGRPDLAHAMHPEGGSAKYPRLRLRNVMVAAQAAVSVVLLLVSVLVLRSLLHIAKVDPGFDRDRVLSAQIQLERDTPPPLRIAFAQGMIERAANLPGVESASVTSLVPLAGNAASTSVAIEQQPDRKGAAALWMNVGPDYFKTLGIPVLRGREFEATDRKGSAAVAVVNEAFVKEYFPHREPLGQRVRVSLADTYREIVGVVRNSDYQFYGEAAQPQLFRPFYQTNGEVFLELRTRGTPSCARAAPRTIIARRWRGRRRN